jgi:hypothetical protein
MKTHIRTHKQIEVFDIQAAQVAEWQYGLSIRQFNALHDRVRQVNESWAEDESPDWMDIFRGQSIDNFVLSMIKCGKIR